MRDLDTGLPVDAAVMAGLRLNFHFSVSGAFTVGSSRGLADDILTNSQLDVWLYGGPVFEVFHTDYSAVCTAPAFGGCVLDGDGDYRLMNDSQAPGTTPIGFDFTRAPSGQATGILWMQLNAMASTGDRAQYRLALDGVGFEPLPAAAGRSSPGGALFLRASAPAPRSRPGRRVAPLNRARGHPAPAWAAPR